MQKFENKYFQTTHFFIKFNDTVIIIFSQLDIKINVFFLFLTLCIWKIKKIRRYIHRNFFLFYCQHII